jgi:hypothetical protein
MILALIYLKGTRKDISDKTRTSQKHIGAKRITNCKETNIPHNANAIACNYR